MAKDTGNLLSEFDEDDVNEDWIKTGPESWDLYLDDHIVNTIDDLLYSLGISTWPKEDQVPEVEALTELPSYIAAPLQLQTEVMHFLGDTAEASHVHARKQTLDSRDIGHRDVTQVEAAAKTNFATIQQQWKNETDELVQKWSTVRNAQIQELTQQIKDAVEAQNVKALASNMADTDGADIITEHMTKMMEAAVTTAKAEAQAQGVSMPTLNTADLAKQLAQQAQGIATIMNRGLSNTASTQALMRYGVQDITPDEVASAVGDHLADLSSSYLDDMLGGALTQAQNSGRIFVMQQAPGDYYSSELLDENTCEECEAVDGTEYDTLADAQADYPTGGYSECLGGPRCRGTIVAVYAEADTDNS